MNVEINKENSHHRCPYCSADLEKQTGFDPSLEEWKCIYCGQSFTLTLPETVEETPLPEAAVTVEEKTEETPLPETVQTPETVSIIRERGGRVVKSLVTVAAVAFGTAVLASEYFIEKALKKAIEIKEEKEKEKQEKDQ